MAALTRILPRCQRRLWQQYAELAQGNPGYGEALEAIDDDLPVYTVDVTEDELSHAEFINAYLHSVGAEPVNLDPFRTVQPPNVKGLRQVARLTNLTDLTVDTSYFTRYQSTRTPTSAPASRRDPRPARDPDLEQAQRPGAGRHRSGRGLHFPSIEQGGRAGRPPRPSRRAPCGCRRWTGPGDVVDHDHGLEAQAGLPDVGDLGRPQRIRELEELHPCSSFRRSARGRRRRRRESAPPHRP